jgi:hypothetical protein
MIGYALCTVATGEKKVHIATHKKDREFPVLANTTVFEGLVSTTTWYDLGISSQNPGRIASNIEGLKSDV